MMFFIIVVALFFGFLVCSSRFDGSIAVCRVFGVRGSDKFKIRMFLGNCTMLSSRLCVCFVSLLLVIVLVSIFI